MNNDKFRANIKRRVERAKEKAPIYMQKFITTLDAKIIQKTPVDKGNLRWNWFIGVGGINYTTEENASGTANDAMARNNAVINTTKYNGQSIFISNSLPYAYRIEYEGWSHTKAPAGMMRLSIEEMRTVASKLAIEVRALR